MLSGIEAGVVKKRRKIRHHTASLVCEDSEPLSGKNTYGESPVSVYL